MKIQRHIIALSIVAIAWCIRVRADDTAPELDPALAAYEAQQIEVMQRAAAATIAVFGQDGNGGGSGVVISPDGYALTNYHVADPCGAHMRCGMSDGRLYDAVIVGLDPTGDVALIKLVGRDDFPTAPMGNSDELRVGQPCFAAGNPFLLATDFQPTLTAGIISGVRRYQYPANTLLEYTDCIQTDAAINPGNSGGPLFNQRGEVIGINGRISIEKRGRVNVGVGYAISINQIKKFMGYLRSGRIVDHATLGFTASDDESGKVVVTNILESSDAFRRGIRYDDEILALDGRDIGSSNDLKNILGTYPRGWRVPITFRRDQEERTVSIRLAALHSTESLLRMLEPQKRALPQPPKRKDNRGEEPEPDKPRPEEAPHPEPLPAVEREKPETELPEAIQSIYEKRRGFANYYFNRQHVRRIHDGLRSQFSEFSADKKLDWIVSGRIKTGGVFRITLGASESAADLPSGLWTIDTTQALDSQLSPDGSGGMLLALHLLREFVITDPAQFGEVTYIGTITLPGHEAQLDATAAVRGAVEMRLYTQPSDGTLTAIELFTDSRRDPCELHFDIAIDEGRGDATAKPGELPISDWTSRFGDRVYGVFFLNQIEAGDPTATGDAP